MGDSMEEDKLPHKKNSFYVMKAQQPLLSGESTPMKT